jgi:signal peptidase I
MSKFVFNIKQTKLTFILLLIVYFCSIINVFADFSKNPADDFFCKKQYEKAIEIYSKILNIDKKNPEILYRIGLCYYLLNHHETANQYWFMAKSINPEIFKNRIYRVPAGSMKPTLIVGDHIIIDLDYCKNNDIKRGEIIVFKYHHDPNRTYLKRVIGLPRDNILIKDKNVYINGQLYIDKISIYSDPRILDSKKAPRDNFGPIIVPENDYFVLGDNRDESFDSRFYGCVNRDMIIGRALVIYFSTSSKDNINDAIPERAGLLIK